MFIKLMLIYGLYYCDLNSTCKQQKTSLKKYFHFEPQWYLQKTQEISMFVREKST